MAKNILYLGVEGGASKSTAILADENGRIIAKKSGKALNYHNIGEGALRGNLSALIFPLLKKVKRGELRAVFGFAGFDTPRDGKIYKKIVSSLTPNNSVFEVLNDAPIALEARCGGEENAILIISGTGSSVYGKSGSKTAKSIGWNFILGDEGSAYSAGISVLKAATRSFDGRTRKTLLEKIVPKRLGTKNMKEFIPKFYSKLRGAEHKLFIASFAPLADRAIEKDDWAGLEIRKRIVGDFLSGAEAVIKRLNLENKKFCAGFTGSQWKMPGLQKMFEKELKRKYKGAFFSRNKDSGAWGAVLLAKKL